MYKVAILKLKHRWGIHLPSDAVNPFNASYSKLQLFFEGFSVIQV